VSDERQFRVLLHWDERQRLPGAPRSVPWSLLAPHEERALRNHDQTLERLNERGGLGVSEMVAVIEDRDVSWVMRASEDETLPALLKHLSDHTETGGNG
jgi:hypothetical protein